MIDFVNVRVGGRDNFIALGRRSLDRGVTFEAPRHSLMTAIQYAILDDLLIGNFMKTTLHSEWEPGLPYRDFTPYPANFGDNDRARSNTELTA